jgi:hypothetical protein
VAVDGVDIGNFEQLVAAQRLWCYGDGSRWSSTADLCRLPVQIETGSTVGIDLNTRLPQDHLRAGENNRALEQYDEVAE